MKFCGHCKQFKEVTEFNKNRSKPDGLHNWCRLCHRSCDRNAYNALPQRKYARRRWSIDTLLRNQAFILQYFLDHPCVDCGEADPVPLEFDHVTGVKTDHVTKLLYRKVPLKTIEDEIAKCEVRCANCHRRKTARTHGSYRLSTPAALLAKQGKFVVDGTEVLYPHTLEIAFGSSDRSVPQDSGQVEQVPPVA